MKKKNIASKLYNISKTIGKIASITRDIEVLTSGDSKKIAKRAKINNNYNDITNLKNDFASLMKDKKGFNIMVFSNNINIDDKCLLYIRHDDKVFSLYNS